MQTQQRVWKLFQQYRVVSFLVSSGIVTALGMGFVQPLPQGNVEGGHGKTFVFCSDTDHIHTLAESDKPETLAARDDVSLSLLIAHERIADPDLIDRKRTICTAGSAAHGSQGENTRPVVLHVPRQPMFPTRPRKPSAPVFNAKRAVPIFSARRLPSSTAKVAVLLKKIAAQMMPRSMWARTATGRGNVFPYGQCTWWADQRYYQLHGVFVPWTTNADASQWSSRARESGWRVSTIPTPGAIIVLQDGVQGASPVGHVGIVEQVFANGVVIASSMNWGSHPGSVTTALFSPGPGVSFLSQQP